jgi:uncharacterized protein YnzC (UPF0291/DUF896 family)
MLFNTEKNKKITKQETQETQEYRENFLFFLKNTFSFTT